MGVDGTKLSPLLNILKNSLLTTPVSQGREGPQFPTPANSLSPSGTKGQGSHFPPKGQYKIFIS